MSGLNSGWALCYLHEPVYTGLAGGKGGGTLRVSTKQVPLKDAGHHCMARGISEDLRALLSSEHMDLVVPCRYLSWDAVFIAFL